MTRLDLYFAFGRPFSPFYSGLMRARSILYEKDILKRHTLQVPVISIGNLTVGGTGKTPVVLALARMLQEEGYHPAIVSRGYGGKADQKSNVVSSGEEILLSAEEAGDEPVMLAKQLPGIPVITGKSRIHPCHQAIERYNADVLLLDDGFQHMAIKRHLDIVLFNATTLAGNSRVLPGGVLREPVHALRRCHAFLLTGVNNVNRDRAERFSDILQTKFPDKPLFFSKTVGYEIWSVDEKTDVNDLSLLGQTSAFCSIANPVRFHESIRMSDIDMVQFSPFADHRKYSQTFLDKICDKASMAGAESLLTTEKDFVKIEHLQWTLPLYVLKINQHTGQDFNNFVLQALKRRE